MLKSLTLSLTLALGFAGAVNAGGLMHGGNSGCTTCGMASPQGMTYAAPQASAQGYVESCGETCAPAKKKCFLDCLKPKPKTYTYEWVLKKKKVHGHKASGCDTCGGATESYVTPSAQYASPQGTYAAPQASYAAPQGYGSSQAYGASQTGSVYPTTETRSAEPTGDAVPPAPSAPSAPAPPAPTGAQSSLLFLNPAGN